MNWNLANILDGAASVQLFPRPIKPHSLMRDIAARAESQNVAVDRMLAHHMRERLIGQLLYTGVSLSALASALYGAMTGWSDVVLVPIALIPAGLSLAVQRPWQPGWRHKSRG